jgi:hypothetical protein
MSDTAKRTKGPWEVLGATIYVRENDYNRFFASVGSSRGTPDEELKANARLMASAPELLDALELAKKGLEAHVEYARGKEDYELFTATVFAMQTIDAAIAKAKGE